MGLICWLLMLFRVVLDLQRHILWSLVYQKHPRPYLEVREHNCQEMISDKWNIVANRCHRVSFKLGTLCSGCGVWCHFLFQVISRSALLTTSSFKRTVQATRKKTNWSIALLFLKQITCSFTVCKEEEYLPVCRKALNLFCKCSHSFIVFGIKTCIYVFGVIKSNVMHTIWSFFDEAILHLSSRFV